MAWRTVLAVEIEPRSDTERGECGFVEPDRTLNVGD